MYKEIIIGKYTIQNAKYCRLNTLTHQARLRYTPPPPTMNIHSKTWSNIF